MPSLFSKKLRESRPVPRIFLWSLLGIFNASLWLLLIAFHWEISLRSREVQYFGTHLFPVQALGVPLPLIYGVCALMTAASAGAILRDRSNLAARERIRALLYQLLDSLDIGVVVLDERNLLTMANDAARRLLPEIPPGNASLEILDLLQSRPRVREMVRLAVGEGNYVRDVEHDLRTDKDPLPVRITTLPLKDSHRRTSGTLLLIRDVSETARMERQMRTAERLSALGTLAAAMAHEIRNPLEAMDLNLALLANQLTSGAAGGEAPKTDRYVKILESEIARLAAIVENFLSFARPSQAPVSEIRLDQVLRRIVDLLANQALSRKVLLDLVTEGEPVVVGSEDQLKQAFLNLVINSLEAMPEGGQLRIRTEVLQPVDTGVLPWMAVVSIQDTGVGIPQEQIAHLFDPYFTTRPKGTGLGLTIVHRIIQDHRGQIRVASLPGRGSTFTVELPLRVAELSKEIASSHG